MLAESGAAGRGQAGRLRGHVPPDAAGRNGPARRQAVAAVRQGQRRGRAGRSCCGTSSRRGLLRRIGYAVSPLARPAADRRDAPTRSSAHAIDVRDAPVCAFLGPQQHLATEYCGQIDPTDLDEYLRHDGFEALRQCLERTLAGADHRRGPAERAARPRRGRLSHRHRSGPRSARPRATTKYIICNGDEGDPGAFMDRMLLESFPYRDHRRHGHRRPGGRAPTRASSTSAPSIRWPCSAIREALRALRGARACWATASWAADFRLQLAVKEGAGAFVCGEETALLASIEGRRGMPRLRPPYPAESGLWGKPTLVNNVETYALVPWIFRHGADGVRRARHREEQGHQGLRPGRQGRAAAG